MRKPHDITQFWTLVDQSGGPAARWPWQGTLKAGTGYGTFSVARKQIGAHRVAWRLANDREIVPGHYVCHRCDNPQCVNPAHLFVGTPRDIARDMIAKGRAAGPLNENAAKTHCPAGHAYDATGRRGDGSSFRVCSICSGEQKRTYKRRQRGSRR